MILGRRGRLFGDTRKSAFVRDQEGGFTGLLDEYTGVAGWSLDQIKSDATESIRVRRSSDNAEQDIGFVDNTLDTTSLLSFVGANDGFVTIIYDQNGTGHNFTQTDPIKQGRIVIGGVLQTLNGKPVVLRSANNGGGYLANVLSFIGDTNIYGTYFVGKRVDLLSSVLFDNSNGTGYAYVSEQSTSTAVNNSPTPSSERLNGVPLTYSTRQDIYNAFANQSLLTAAIDFNYSVDGYSLGYRFSSPVTFGMYHFQEHVILTDNSNQLAVEANINSRWNVF